MRKLIMLDPAVTLDDLEYFSPADQEMYNETGKIGTLSESISTG